MEKFIQLLTNDGVKYAIFDVDNTITKSNILELYIYSKRKKVGNSKIYKLWFIYFVILKVPIYLILDFFSSIMVKEIQTKKPLSLRWIMYNKKHEKIIYRKI